MTKIGSYEKIIGARNLEILNLKFDLAKMIWDKLGDVPVDEEDCIDRDFKTGYREVFFPKGTEREQIWHWFEYEFDVSVVNLMDLKEK